MLRYSADEQLKLTFKSTRQEGLANTFSGTGDVAATSICLKDPAAAGRSLAGRVIFRSPFHPYTHGRVNVCTPISKHAHTHACKHTSMNA